MNNTHLDKNQLSNFLVNEVKKRSSVVAMFLFDKIIDDNIFTCLTFLIIILQDIGRKVVSQDSRAKPIESNRLTEDISAENNKREGRLNLKQWSLDVEKTRRNGSSSDEEANNLNIKHAR